MRRMLWPLVGLVALVARVEAQPAEAIGQPLPAPDLLDGTVSLRVIAGDVGKPVSGIEATMIATPPDGTSAPVVRRARTDADGRVSFTGVEPDAMVQLKVPAEAAETGEVESARFPMAERGGVQVMMSTLPFAGSGGMSGAGGPGGAQGGPTAGGAGGGPPTTPRAMSGQSRTAEDIERDQMVVRLSYDDFTDKEPPRDQPVLVVGYRFDLVVGGTIVKTDANGRATFSGLDRRGATTYFAMTLLPRGDDHDRLVSAPMLMPGDAGLRLVLSGDKRDATAVVDDLGRIDPQPATPVPPGVVDVGLAGLVQPGDPVELIDALTGKVVATTKAGAAPPNPESIAATWDGSEDATLADGVLVVVVDANAARAAGATVTVRRHAAAADPAPTPQGADWTATTDANGEARLSGLPTGAELDLLVTVDGMAAPARPVTLPAKGGRRELGRITWQPRGQGAARFTGVAGGPERAYVARGYLRNQPCLSAPFQLTATRGASATVLVFPRILFGFSLRASIHDLYLGARGTFTLRNSSLAPYLPGTIGKVEELVIPLPRGFIGGEVDPQFQGLVSVDKTRGFIIRDPVPPGGIGFVGHFSLKTGDGEVTWDLDLPFGTLESGMEIKRTAKMEVDLPPRMPVREATDERGSWYVLSPISVQPEQRMIFKLTGLPQAAAWTTWSRDIIGLLVLLLLLTTVSIAIFRPARAGAAASPTRRDALIDELAALSTASDEAAAARREELLDELEALDRAGGGRGDRSEAAR